VKKRSKDLTAGEQILMDHVRELRARVLVCAVILVVGGVIGYLFYEPILQWLRSPLGMDLYYGTPAGSFNFIIKVASMVGVLAAVPFFVYQLITFVQPAFQKRLSRLRVFMYSIASVFLAAIGAAFAFYVILPGALRFFAGFQVEGLSALIDANNYLNFVTNAIVTFIIVFQIPLLMIIIDRIKPIQPKKLLQMEKWVILGGLIVSLFVPFALDITTSLLIASPIVLLYNISVLIIIIRHAIAHRKKAKRVTKKKATKREVFNWQDQLKNNSAGISPDAVSMLEIIAKQKPVHHEPRDTKPSRASDIAALRDQVRIKREQEIARRVAEHNASPANTINDIR